MTKAPKEMAEKRTVEMKDTIHYLDPMAAPMAVYILKTNPRWDKQPPMYSEHIIRLHKTSSYNSEAMDNVALYPAGERNYHRKKKGLEVLKDIELAILNEVKIAEETDVESFFVHHNVFFGESRTMEKLIKSAEIFWVDPRILDPERSYGIRSIMTLNSLHGLKYFVNTPGLGFYHDSNRIVAFEELPHLDGRIDLMIDNSKDQPDWYEVDLTMWCRPNSVKYMKLEEK